MTPVPVEVKHTAKEDEVFPKFFVAYQLDGNPLTVDQREEICEKLWYSRGKYIVYGENTAAVETENRAFIAFFPESDDYSHGSVWGSIQGSNPTYEVKAAGMADFFRSEQSLSGSSYMLKEVIDEGKQAEWKQYLAETLGIVVL